MVGLSKVHENLGGWPGVICWIGTRLASSYGSWLFFGGENCPGFISKLLLFSAVNSRQVWAQINFFLPFVLCFGEEERNKRKHIAHGT